MSFESQLKPSPMVHHSTPGLLAERSSPTSHLPHFMNWTAQTRQPRAIARTSSPPVSVWLRPRSAPARPLVVDGDDLGPAPIAKSISVAVGESDTMWLGRFASVMVAPSALLIVTVKPALAGASGAVPAVPQAPRRAAPAAARNG